MHFSFCYPGKNAFHTNFPRRTREYNLNFNLNPPPEPEPSGFIPLEKDLGTSSFYPSSNNPHLLPSFLSLPQSLRVFRVREREREIIVHLSFFTSQLRIFLILNQVYRGSSTPMPRKDVRSLILLRRSVLVWKS